MKQQRGSVLIISLLILLVMTMIGISAMSGSTLEEKMAASDRNHKVVFQNGETALKQAESTLLKADYNSVIRAKLATKEKGYYRQDDARFNYLTPTAWKDKCVTDPSNSNACYVVEDQGLVLNPGEAGEYGQTANPERGSLITKITVRSSDTNGMSAAILQSNLQKTITY